MEPKRDNLFLMAVIGRLSSEKDHARIFRVLSCLQHLSPERDWRCLIFGAGVLKSHLMLQARTLGIESRIVWMGYRAQVGEELAGADVVLSLSKAEGLPINLLEAGWAGTPGFCTAVGGVNDLIPDDRFGNRIEPDESDEKSARRLALLISPEGSKQLESQGTCFQERVTTEFTQAKWIQRLQVIYSELDRHAA
jgi:glycosyltransferase EpsD